jgi:hypothetical protein
MASGNIGYDEAKEREWEIRPIGQKMEMIVEEIRLLMNERREWEIRPFWDFFQFSLYSVYYYTVLVIICWTI